MVEVESFMQCKGGIFSASAPETGTFELYFPTCNFSRGVPARCPGEPGMGIQQAVLSVF
jgi:hypothetical protein